MLNRKRQDTDLFPTQCEVRGCDTPPGDWFPDGETTFEVCTTHELELRAGEPYTADEGEVLVGRDCTGEVLGVHLTRTATSETTVLRLGRDGVVHQEVDLEVPENLRTVLDALGADGAGRRGDRDREDH